MKPGPKATPPETRMWAYIEKTPTCWVWVGKIDTKGYGVIAKSNGRFLRAHRVSYEFHCGPIPRGLHVLHKCDVRHCVNPEHLFTGTHADNMADMKQKKRSGWQVKPEKTRHPGETNGRAKVTGAQVVAIRERHAAGATISALCEEFDLTYAPMCDLLSGKHWGEVGGPLRNPHKVRGEECHAAKLTAADVLSIRERAATGMPRKALADEYGLKVMSIGKVIRRDVWKHI